MPVVTLYPTIDTRIIDAGPDTAYGTNPALVVGAGGPNRRDRALLKLDLSAIPAGAVITAATLQLYEYYYTGAPSFQVDLRRVLRAWVESTATWNRFDGTTPWGAAGCSAPTDRADAPSWTGQVPGINGAWQTFASAGLLADLQAWCDGSAENHGWLLSSPAEGGAATAMLAFYSSDHTDPLLHPKIEIAYQVPYGVQTVFADSLRRTHSPGSLQADTLRRTLEPSLLLADTVRSTSSAVSVAADTSRRTLVDNVFLLVDTLRLLFSAEHRQWKRRSRDVTHEPFETKPKSTPSWDRRYHQTPEWS